MKKFLSLVLALVMTMSLVTVSAGAKSFDDAEDIQYVEAVEVLNLIGVLEGYPDGSFQPKTVLTRAQAATIIAKLLLTPDVATELTADAAPFADVPADNWAAAYIAEGVQSGILSGMGDGTFAPNAQLTGFAYLKMLLCALGFDAEAEGMTGANWSINVAKLAKKLELTDGNDAFVGKNPVTREEAALYTFNAMQKKTVEGYSNDGGVKITVGDVVIESVAGTAEQTGATLLKSTYKDLERHEDGEDDFGRVGIYWTYDDEESEVVYEAADYVLVAEETYEATEEATALAQLLEDKELDEDVVAGNVLKDEIAIGTVVELWLDDEDEVEDYITYTYAKTTVLSVEDDIDDEEHEYEVGISAIYELDGLDAYTYVDAFEKCDDKKCADCKKYYAIGEWEEDDIILLTINEDGEAVEFAEIETVDGEISSKKAGYVKVDGEKYFTELDIDFDVKYTFYLDANGIIFAAGDPIESDDEDEQKEYVYVLKAQADLGSDGDLFTDAEDAAAKVKVMYIDGEIEVVDYNVFENDDEDVVFELNGDEEDIADFEDLVAEGWYSYEMEDGMISLTEETAETIEVSDARAWAGDLRANADTELVLLDKDGVYETYTGRTEMPEMELKNALVVLDGKTVVAVYNYAKEYEEEAETIDVAMFVEIGEETADGYEVEFIVAGETETYVVADVEALTAAGLLFEITIDEDDIATVAALTEGELVKKGEVTFVDGEYFELGDTDLEMTDDCAVYQVNKDGDKVSDGKLAKGKNVVVILNTDGDAVEIFQYKGIALGL